MISKATNRKAKKKKMYCNLRCSETDFRCRMDFEIRDKLLYLHILSLLVRNQGHAADASKPAVLQQRLLRLNTQNDKTFLRHNESGDLRVQTA